MRLILNDAISNGQSDEDIDKLAKLLSGVDDAKQMPFPPTVTPSGNDILVINALDNNCSGKNLTELIESCEDNRKRCATDRNTENIILEETSSIQQQSKRSRYSHNEYDTNRGNPSLSQSNDGIEIISQLHGNLFLILTETFRQLLELPCLKQIPVYSSI
jgi:hypothetical protein